MPRRSNAAADPAFARVMDYQRTLAAFSRIAAGSLSAQRLMQLAAGQVARITHIKRAKVLRYRPDQGDLLVEAGVGWRPGVVGNATLPIDRTSPPGQAIQSGVPIIIDDLPNDAEYQYSPLLREHGIVSLANVPLMVDGKTWGVLEVDHDEPHRFDDIDTGFLMTFANVLGMALRCHEAGQVALAASARHAQELAQAEILLRELQHRVKNNFQTIIAFMSLQRREISQEDRERFQSVMNRVHAIALAHDQLSLGQGGSEVEFGDYLRALCANIDPHREGVLIEVHASTATLPLDHAVPAGLIVNELVTNCLKYAFDERGGTITVVFSVDPEIGESCVMVADSGKGMGPQRTGSLGLTLVDAFTTQLGGRVEHHEVETGTRIAVCFPAAL